MTTESIYRRNLEINLIDKVKSLLKDVEDKHKIHDFDSEMAIRAERTAELYQLFDSMAKDQSKFELLELKQRLRKKIELMESDIKDEVAELLIEESKKSDKLQSQEITKLNKNDSKASLTKPFKSDLKTNIKNIKPSSVFKTSKDQFHTYESYGPSCSKKFTSKNLPKKTSFSNPAINSNVMNFLNYPTKTFPLPASSCSCFQNAYFYPLAQPSRLRKEYLPINEVSFHKQKKNTSLSKANIDKSVNVQTIQEEDDSPIKQAENKINPRNLFVNKKTEIDFNSYNNNPAFLTSNKQDNDYIQKTSTDMAIHLNKDSQKIKQNKSVQTEYLQSEKLSDHKSKTKTRKTKDNPNYFHKRSKQKKYLGRNDWKTESYKAKTVVSKSTQYREQHLQNKSFYQNNSNDSQNNSLDRRHIFQKEINNHINLPSENITELQRQQVDNSEVSSILSRFSNMRNEQDVLSLYSSVLPYLQQTNTSPENNQPHEISSNFNKEFLEQLIVEVLHENLQNLHLSSSEKNEMKSDNIEEHSLVGTEQHSLESSIKSNLEKSASKRSIPSTPEVNIELNEDSNHEISSQSNYEESKFELPEPPATPEISISSSSSSDNIVPESRQLPPTPSLSEKDSDEEEELLQHTSINASVENVNPVPTPNSTSPSHSIHSPEHILTPAASPSPQHDSEPPSIFPNNEKSVKDVAVQISKLSNSVESTVITISNSLSESTDEFISDGELLFMNYGQISALKRKKETKKKSVKNDTFDKSITQNYQSSYSEGEIHLISIDKYKQQEKDADNSSELLEQNQEQVSEDISEGQVVLQKPSKYLKLFIDQASHVKPIQDLSSHSLSESEITENNNQPKNPFLSSTIAENFNIDETPVKDISN